MLDMEECLEMGRGEDFGICRTAKNRNKGKTKCWYLMVCYRTVYEQKYMT